MPQIDIDLDSTESVPDFMGGPSAQARQWDRDQIIARCLGLWILGIWIWGFIEFIRMLWWLIGGPIMIGLSVCFLGLVSFQFIQGLLEKQE